MANFKIIGIRDHKEYLEIAIDYLSEKWGIDRKIYNDCLSNSVITENPLPRWYLLLKGKGVIGCCGLITNDFISRQDLYPWLCALFVEERERGRKLGAKLIEHVKAEAAASGYKKIYLSTNLEGYYEKYGWEKIATGYHPWGAESTIFESETALNSDKV